MGVDYARNMYSDLQQITKYYTKCHLVGTFLKLKKIKIYSVEVVEVWYL
jgi:hypothetical protein